MASFGNPTHGTTETDTPLSTRGQIGVVVVQSIPWDEPKTKGEPVYCPGYGILDLLVRPGETFPDLLERLQGLIPSPLTELVIISKWGWVDNTGTRQSPHVMFPKTLKHYRVCQKASGGKSLAARAKSDAEVEDLRPISAVPNIDKLIFAVLREQDVVRAMRNCTEEERDADQEACLRAEPSETAGPPARRPPTTEFDLHNRTTTPQSSPSQLSRQPTMAFPGDCLEGDEVPSSAPGNVEPTWGGGGLWAEEEA
jgi:hypothetical protein